MANPACAMAEPPSEVAPPLATPAVPALRFAQPFFDRVLPALLFGVLALSKGRGVVQLWTTPVDSDLQARLTHALTLGHICLTLAFTVLLATLFATRRTPISGRAGPLAMMVALGGTFIMWIALAQPVTTNDSRLLAVSDVVAAIGLVFAMYALGALRFCFGIAPEARGLVTDGAYKLVRHPVYLGEFVALFGALLPVLAPFTALIFALFCFLQAVRASLEERVLSDTFADYAAYRLCTPALVPWPRL
jgi:protein-S-isoprenylcysteine O-methyltransferase Ste14